VVAKERGCGGPHETKKGKLDQRQNTDVKYRRIHLISHTLRMAQKRGEAHDKNKNHENKAVSTPQEGADCVITSPLTAY
jgi:hypothetical protein